MSTIIVRGGLPGKVRVELEGTDVGLDLNVGLQGLDMIHALKPLMEQLADYVAPTPPMPAEVASVEHTAPGEFAVTVAADVAADVAAEES